MRTLEQLMKLAISSWKKRIAGKPQHGKPMTISQCVSYYKNLINNYGCVLAIGKNGICSSPKDIYTMYCNALRRVTLSEISKEYFEQMNNTLFVWENNTLYECKYSDRMAKKYFIN